MAHLILLLIGLVIANLNEVDHTQGESFKHIT